VPTFRPAKAINDEINIMERESPIGRAAKRFHEVSLWRVLHGARMLCA